MLALSPRWIGLLTLVTAFLTASLVLGDDEEKEVAHSFKMAIFADVTTESKDAKQKMQAKTEMDYVWKHRGQERTLRLHSFAVKIKVADTESTDLFMSRSKVTATIQGVTKETDIEKAPEAFRQSLRESFDVPLFKLDVDSNGKETKRMFVGGANAKKDICDSVVVNATFFHPPFHHDRDEWQTESQVSVGPGKVAKGTLTYKKIAKSAGVWTCKVSGTLVNESGGNGDFKAKFKYVFSGEQSYDLAAKEWQSARLRADMTLETSGEGEQMSGKAKMVLTLERTDK